MSTAIDSPNQALLTEVNGAGTWFHAKKTVPIWAKMLTEDQTVETLEGTEQVQAGDFLCRGEIGEVWPQSAESLNKKYIKTQEVADGWIKYSPNPDAQGVMAAAVLQEFVVQTSWGELSGKAGDFVVKNYVDAGTSYPSDIWIVDKELFAATYERVE